MTARLACLAVSLSTALTALAQTATNPSNPFKPSSTLPDTLPDQRVAPVVVTAQFVPTDVRQTVNSVRVLDRQTLERRSAVSLEEALQTEAGIRFSQDPILGNSLAINGLRGENVKILVDGVPVVGRLNGSVDAGQLPLGAVQQVEIIEGAQSLLYGSEASAGVINLVTRRSQVQRYEAEASAQQESNGYRNVQARAGARVGKFFVQLTGNRLDFKPEADTAAGRDQLWNPKTQHSGRALLRFSPSERLDLRLSGSLFGETVDNLGAVRRPQYKPYAFDDYYHTRRADLSLHGEGRTRANLFWQSTLGWNRFGRRKNTYRFDLESAQQSLVGGEQDTSAATGFLARATLATDRRDRAWNFLLGAENYLESAEGVRIVDSSSATPGFAWGNDLGIFGSAKVHILEQLTLQGGARWTHNRRYGAALTPSVWLRWRPAKAWSVRVSWANGFRSPGLKELYFNFIDINHYVVGNASLRPERSHNLRGEIAWQPDKKAGLAPGLTLAGFYNQVHDRIVLAAYGPVEYHYANLQQWKTVGGSLGFTLAAGDWLRFRSEAVVTGFYNTFSEQADSIRTYDWAPDWVNDLTLSFAGGKWGATIWHKYTGRTPFFFEEDNTLKQGRTDGWHLLNIALNAAFFERKLRLNAGVKNLLNTRQIRSGTAEELHGDGMPDLRPVHWGRTFFVSVTVAVGKE